MEKGSDAGVVCVKIMNTRIKFFIFSDESGSWHNSNDIYVRSWVIVGENEYKKLIMKVDEISHFIGSNELKWHTLAGNQQYFGYFNNVNFRIFITVSSPKDINWDKYRLTRNFNISIENFDFGELDDQLILYIKDRIYRDIKNALFMHFYERYHIENAKKSIERIIKPSEYNLIYRIDPPQMSQEGWKNILYGVSSSPFIDVEFPKSERSQGVQFADIIAGCFRSLLLRDKKFEEAKKFLRQIKNHLIPKNEDFYNPNLIFYGEVNEELKNNCARIWNY